MFSLSCFNWPIAHFTPKLRVETAISHVKVTNNLSAKCIVETPEHDLFVHTKEYIVKNKTKIYFGIQDTIQHIVRLFGHHSETMVITSPLKWNALSFFIIFMRKRFW